MIAKVLSGTVGLPNKPLSKQKKKLSLKSLNADNVKYKSLTLNNMSNACVFNCTVKKIRKKFRKLKNISEGDLIKLNERRIKQKQKLLRKTKKDSVPTNNSNGTTKLFNSAVCCDLQGVETATEALNKNKIDLKTYKKMINKSTYTYSWMKDESLNVAINLVNEMNEHDWNEVGNLYKKLKNSGIKHTELVKFVENTINRICGFNCCAEVILRLIDRNVYEAALQLSKLWINVYHEVYTIMLMQKKKLKERKLEKLKLKESENTSSIKNNIEEIIDSDNNTNVDQENDNKLDKRFNSTKRLSLNRSERKAMSELKLELKGIVVEKIKKDLKSRSHLDMSLGHISIDKERALILMNYNNQLSGPTKITKLVRKEKIPSINKENLISNEMIPPINLKNSSNNQLIPSINLMNSSSNDKIPSINIKNSLCNENISSINIRKSFSNEMIPSINIKNSLSNENIPSINLRNSLSDENIQFKEKEEDTQLVNPSSLAAQIYNDDCSQFHLNENDSGEELSIDKAIITSYSKIKENCEATNNNNDCVEDNLFKLNKDESNLLDTKLNNIVKRNEHQQKRDYYLTARTYCARFINFTNMGINVILFICMDSLLSSLSVPKSAVKKSLFEKVIESSVNFVRRVLRLVNGF